MFPGDEDDLDQLRFPPGGNMSREKTKCLVNFPGCEGWRGGYVQTLTVAILLFKTAHIFPSTALAVNLLSSRKFPPELESKSTANLGTKQALFENIISVACWATSAINVIF